MPIRKQQISKRGFPNLFILIFERSLGVFDGIFNRPRSDRCMSCLVCHCFFSKLGNWPAPPKKWPMPKKTAFLGYRLLERIRSFIKYRHPASNHQQGHKGAIIVIILVTIISEGQGDIIVVILFTIISEGKGRHFAKSLLTFSMLAMGPGRVR